jgi:hypothetical protein
MSDTSDALAREFAMGWQCGYRKATEDLTNNPSALYKILVREMAKAICTARGPEPQCLWHEWQVEAAAALDVVLGRLR